MSRSSLSLPRLKATLASDALTEAEKSRLRALWGLIATDQQQPTSQHSFEYTAAVYQLGFDPDRHTFLNNIPPA